LTYKNLDKMNYNRKFFKWRFFIASIVSIFLFFFFRRRESIDFIVPILMAISALANFSLFLLFFMRKSKEE
tara:strand:+ start:9751 stop:9963 length:213 start_codon:yes stop_codon:yes gene_type:complete